MEGQSVDRLVRSADNTGEETQLTKATIAGEPIHVTTSRLRKDGQAIRVEVYGVPLIVNGRLAGGIGIYKDVSEQTRLEEELLLAKKLHAVGQLAGGVAHDFNNIIGIIQGYSESLLDQLPAESPLRESVNEILVSSKRATALTRQLLAFGRKQVIQPQTLDLNRIVNEMSNMLRRLLGEDLEFSIINGKSLGMITADPNQVEQIILNLAVNARDAMPRGGKMTIETGNIFLHEIYSSTYAPIPAGRYVMLAVCDNGTGMSPETKQHIFDPFFTTKEKGKGTGLGLATVYGIVQQAGGFVRVDSELGAGTAFRIFFPYIEQHASPEPEPRADGRVIGGTETILLLEDEESFRKVTGDFLTGIGYNVLVAESGSEATRIVQLHPETIHMMLTDVVMPEISGPQLARIVAILRPEVRVLFMSGHTDGALEQKAILDKDVAFIQKPFTRSSLALKIREVLDTTLVPEETQHTSQSQR
jgi:two-component system, cell cycle sensor histidine kinase and response regulator CckA